MFEKLLLNGEINGSFDGKDFRIELDGRSGKAYFTSVETLQFLKDAFFHKLKELKNNPTFKKAMEEADFEVFLNDELIIRIGKNAKSNFVSSMLGVSHIEVVSNSQMSELMKLM
jgi:hypothetical protein